MNEQTFRELEHQGWVDKAAAYREVFTKVSSQAIDPILQTCGDLSGKRFLDIACGTGELASAAADRGAEAEGVDFASSMVEQASAAFADTRFREADAEQLPYPAASFDAAACSFGILHMPHPEMAIAEARRVLVDGGIYTFTTWCTPEQGGDFFGVVLGAVQQFGTLDVPLPPAPPIFRFAEPEECTKVLESAGFTETESHVIDLRWHARDAHDVLELIYKSIVRTPMILEAQPPEARARIHHAILEGTEGYRRGAEIDMGFPALLTTAVAA